MPHSSQGRPVQALICMHCQVNADLTKKQSGYGVQTKPVFHNQAKQRIYKHYTVSSNVQRATWTAAMQQWRSV